MDIKGFENFTCVIRCDTEDEQKEYLEKLKCFEGYKIGEEKDDWIQMVIVKPENNNVIWVELVDGRRVPQQTLKLHNFLIGRGFGMSDSGFGRPLYCKG